MGARVLALIEDTIGTKLLLASRLTTLGYQVTILSAPGAFRDRVRAEAFDWLILDAAALPPGRRRFLDHLQRHRQGARIVWCGQAPRGRRVPSAATFAKPLRYDDIERFFARWTAVAPGEASPAGGAGPGGRGPHPLPAAEGEGRGAAAEPGPGSATTGGGEQR